MSRVNENRFSVVREPVFVERTSMLYLDHNITGCLGQAKEKGCETMEGIWRNREIEISDRLILVSGVNQFFASAQEGVSLDKDRLDSPVLSIAPEVTKNTKPIPHSSLLVVGYLH